MAKVKKEVNKQEGFTPIQIEKDVHTDIKSIADKTGKKIYAVVKDAVDLLKKSIEI